VTDVHQAIIGRALCSAIRIASGTSERWVNCEPSTRQRIYFANHSSHLDIIVLWSALPPPVRRLTRPAAARDYWEKNALRRYLALKVFHAIMIQRPEREGSGFADAARSLEDSLAGMGDTYSLILFPEGTRGEGEEMAPFKSGLFHMARRKPGLELVPVYMENLNRILPKGALFPVPLISSISFGRPLVLAPNEGKLQFLGRARQAILDLARE
jgi:1-acyl-sn-glycerol-3-phosphate acyltransferase